MKKGQLRKGLALLAAVVMVLQMGSAMAFAAPIRRSVKPKAATTATPGVVQVFSGSGGTFDGTSYDKGIVCYVVNTNTALDYTIKCATGANVKNIVYLIVEASETPPMPNITFEGFRSGTDEIIVVSSDYQGNTFVINDSQLKRSVPAAPSLAVAVVTGVTSLSNGVAANKAWAIHANSTTAAYQAGDSVILRAIPLKGQTDVTCQWYEKASKDAPTGTEIGGATGLVYTFTAADAGSHYYYCVISGGSAPGTTAVQEITIQAEPEPACNKTAAIDSVIASPTSVQPDDADKTVTLTATVTLSGDCDIHSVGSPHGFTVDWSSTPSLTITPDSAANPKVETNGNLTFKATMTVPAGTAAGSVTATATLKKNETATGQTGQATVTVKRLAPIIGGTIGGTGKSEIILDPNEPLVADRTYTR